MSTLSTAELKEDEVELDIRYVGLNFKVSHLIDMPNTGPFVDSGPTQPGCQCQLPLFKDL